MDNNNNKQDRVCVDDAGDSAPHRRDAVRQVRVSGYSEGSLLPDRGTLRVRVTNTKDSVGLVSSSVSRRLEYIHQTLRQHGVGDQEVSVRRSVRREGGGYHMDAQVTVESSDLDMMDRVCCVLLDKLDKSVSLGEPQYHHSTESLSDLRRRVCVAAVENAQRKAADVSRLLGQTLGPPLLVREEETREWRSGEEGGGGGGGGGGEEEEEREEEDGVRRHRDAALLRVPLRGPVASALSRVSVTFQFLDKTRKKH